MCQHEHKVDETHKRSILKAVTARILEVTIDATIFYIIGLPIFESLGLAVLVELTCFLICYGLERIWNRIDYGRKVIKC